MVMSAPDGPEHYFQPREFAGNVEGETARALQLCQVFGAEFQGEIGLARVEGDLPRCHRHGSDADARQVQVDQLANPLHRPDLEVRRQPLAQFLRITVGTGGEYEGGIAEQLVIVQWRYLDAVLTLLQGQFDGVLLQHHGQNLADGDHQFAEARSLVAVLIAALQSGPADLAGVARQLAEHRQQLAIDVFGVGLLQGQVMTQYGLDPVDQLQHQEITYFRRAGLAGSPHALGQDVAPVSEHADDFLDAGLQKRTGLEMQVGGNIVQVQADHAVGRGVQDLAKFQPHAGLAVLFITKLQAKVGL